MKLIYVAGPFRGPTTWDIEQNVRVAEVEALKLWQLGIAVFCPHLNGRYFIGAVPEDSIWPNGDLEILSRCDAIYMGPGWSGSPGAHVELTIAMKLGLRCFYHDDIESLKEWVRE